jgi:hypothetical protein
LNMRTHTRAHIHIRAALKAACLWFDAMPVILFTVDVPSLTILTVEYDALLKGGGGRVANYDQNVCCLYVRSMLS